MLILPASPYLHVDLPQKFVDHVVLELDVRIRLGAEMTRGKNVTVT
jgi:hypothetical protein